MLLCRVCTRWRHCSSDGSWEPCRAAFSTSILTTTSTNSPSDLTAAVPKLAACYSIASPSRPWPSSRCHTASSSAATTSNPKNHYPWGHMCEVHTHFPELIRPPIPILSRPWIPELFRPGCRALLAQEFDVGFCWRSILLRGSFGLFAAAFIRFPFPARGSGVCAGPFFAMGAFLAHAFAFELDPVRVMDDAVEDGVGIGGVADEIVPFLDGRLAGDDGGAAAIALLDEFEEVVAGRGVENLQTKIVEDEHLGA